MAYDLPSAFPDTVSAAIIALKRTLIKIDVPSTNCFARIAALAAPRMMPQI